MLSFELRVDENLPGSDKLRMAINPGWIQSQEVIQIPLVQLLLRDLHRGEAEAIALASQIRPIGFLWMNVSTENMLNRLVCM